jgi:hypothetical protein
MRAIAGAAAPRARRPPKNTNTRRCRFQTTRDFAAKARAVVVLVKARLPPAPARVNGCMRRNAAHRAPLQLRGVRVLPDVRGRQPLHVHAGARVGGWGPRARGPAGGTGRRVQPAPPTAPHYGRHMTRTCTDTHARTHARTRTHTHAYTRTHTHARTHARTHAHTHTHTRRHTRTHAYTHAYTRTHTHRHTDAPALARTRARTPTAAQGLVLLEDYTAMCPSSFGIAVDQALRARGADAAETRLAPRALRVAPRIGARAVRQVERNIAATNAYYGGLNPNGPGTGPRTSAPGLAPSPGACHICAGTTTAEGDGQARAAAAAVACCMSSVACCGVLHVVRCLLHGVRCLASPGNRRQTSIGCGWSDAD